MSAFAPFEDFAAVLLPHAFSGTDGAHDVAHIARVWKNARHIQKIEGGDDEVLFAATMLHDCIAIEKNDPQARQASRMAADKAAAILAALGWDEKRLAAVRHAIEAHSFSANLTPQTLEARILQDADRLDSLGMLGVARTFYISGRMGTALYHPDEPVAVERQLDDKRYAIDHFHTKLLKLADGFQTITGAELAKMRHARLLRFLDEFLEEV
ncbi:MAG: HD domain-containing protein [Rhizobiaceae bacterium]